MSNFEIAYDKAFFNIGTEDEPEYINRNNVYSAEVEQTYGGRDKRWRLKFEKNHESVDSYSFIEYTSKKEALAGLRNFCGLPELKKES